MQAAGAVTAYYFNEKNESTGIRLGRKAGRGYPVIDIDLTQTSPQFSVLPSYNADIEG